MNKVLHDDSVERIKEYTTRHKEKINLALSECNTYLREHKEQVQDILLQYGSFKFGPRVPEPKID